MEWDYGEYEGLTTAEIRRRRPDWDLFRDGCPGGESVEAVAARADRVIARVARDRGPDAPVRPQPLLPGPGGALAGAAARGRPVLPDVHGVAQHPGLRAFPRRAGHAPLERRPPRPGVNRPDPVRAARRCIPGSQTDAPSSKLVAVFRGHRRHRTENPDGDPSPGGSTGPDRRPDRPPGAGARLLREPSRSGRPAAARRLRHQRAPGHAGRQHVHRGAHPGDHPGDLRLPPRSGDRRAAVPGQGHARPLGPRPADGARGPGRGGGRDGPPARRRVHAHAGDLARDPRVQPRPYASTRATGS